MNDLLFKTGTMIRTLRLKKGATQRQCMYEVFPKYRRKSRWQEFEQGMAKITLEELWAITQYFQVSLDDLTGNLFQSSYSEGVFTEDEFHMMLKEWIMLSKNQKHALLAMIPILKSYTLTQSGIN